MQSKMMSTTIMVTYRPVSNKELVIVQVYFAELK